MRILWFNWRDTQNPEAGGAEVFTHEIMKRLAKRGYEMTLLTPLTSGKKRMQELSFLLSLLFSLNAHDYPLDNCLVHCVKIFYRLSPDVAHLWVKNINTL